MQEIHLFQVPNFVGWSEHVDVDPLHPLDLALPWIRNLTVFRHKSTVPGTVVELFLHEAVTETCLSGR